MVTRDRIWKTPELRVLARSRPEEAVLAGCKFGSTLGPGDPAMKCKRNNVTPCNSRMRS